MISKKAFLVLISACPTVTSAWYRNTWKRELPWVRVWKPCRIRLTVLPAPKRRGVFMLMNRLAWLPCKNRWRKPRKQRRGSVVTLMPCVYMIGHAWAINTPTNLIPMPWPIRLRPAKQLVSPDLIRIIRVKVLINLIIRHLMLVFTQCRYLIGLSWTTFSFKRFISVLTRWRPILKPSLRNCFIRVLEPKLSRLSLKSCFIRRYKCSSSAVITFAERLRHA